MSKKISKKSRGIIERLKNRFGGKIKIADMRSDTSQKFDIEDQYQRFKKEIETGKRRLLPFRLNPRRGMKFPGFSGEPKRLWEKRKKELQRISKKRGVV